MSQGPEIDARSYVQKHDLNKVFEDLLQQLVVNKPEDPVNFLISYLRQQKGRKLVLLGPQGSGAEGFAQQLHKRYGCAVLRPTDIIAAASSTTDGSLASQAQSYAQHPDKAPDILMAQLARLAKKKAQETGWVMVDFPRTRAQAVALQAAGVIPDRVILLSAKEATLRDRAGTKDESVLASAWAFYSKHEQPLREAFLCAVGVDANGDSDDAFHRIVDVIEQSVS